MDKDELEKLGKFFGILLKIDRRNNPNRYEKNTLLFRGAYKGRHHGKNEDQFTV